MQERGPKPPLSKTDRDLYNSVSSGLTRSEILRRIKEDQKNPNSIFPSYFDEMMLDASIGRLLDRGLFGLVVTPKGQSEFGEDLRRRVVVEHQIRPARPSEKVVIEMPRPAPIVRPPKIIPQSSARDLPKPPSSIPPTEVQPKKKDERIKDFRDLDKLRDQFKKD